LLYLKSAQPEKVAYFLLMPSEAVQNSRAERPQKRPWFFSETTTVVPKKINGGSRERQWSFFLHTPTNGERDFPELVEFLEFVKFLKFVKFVKFLKF